MSVFKCWDAECESEPDASQLSSEKPRYAAAEYAEQVWDAGGRESLKPIRINVRDEHGELTEWTVTLSVEFIAGKRKKP